MMRVYMGRCDSGCEDFPSKSFDLAWHFDFCRRFLRHRKDEHSSHNSHNPDDPAALTADLSLHAAGCHHLVALVQPASCPTGSRAPAFGFQRFPSHGFEPQRR